MAKIASKVYLDRRYITGKLSSKTPVSVIFYIAECHGIEIEKNILSHSYAVNVIRKINDLPVVTFPEAEINDNLGAISQFLSPSSFEWRRSSLILALEWLLKFNCNLKLNFDELPNSYGSLSPRKPENLDVCILYNLCCRFGIDVPGDATDEKMFQLYQIARFPLRYLEMSVKSLNFDKMSRGQLLNILLAADQNLQLIETPKAITREELDTEIRAWPSQQWLPENVNSHVRAIIVGAYCYNLDLSKVENPLLTFGYCQKDVPGAAPSGKKPVWLKTEYNPLLPDKLYGKGVLQNLVYEEGYVSSDLRESLRNLLDTAYTMPSFVLGKGTTENRLNDATLVTYEDINDLSVDECISFGSRASDQYFVTTYDELYQGFKNYQILYNPTSTIFSVFDDRVARRLMILANRKGRKELGSLVKDLLNAKPLDVAKNLLIFRSKNLMPGVQTVLTKIRDMAFYMRGWKVTAEQWPLHSMQTYNIGGAKNPERIQKNVLEAIHDLMTHVEQNKNVDFVLDFPLVVKKDNVLKLADNDEGPTIRDRIKIVRKGKTADINSCIRISSNWFLHTYCTMSAALGFDSQFNISDIAYIS